MEDYQRYLRSAGWRKRKQAALERADHRCQICNSKRRLHVHHRTYERLGDERAADLTVLCERCHRLFHGVVPEPRKREREFKEFEIKAAARKAPRQQPKREEFVPRHIREPRDWREERELPRKIA